MSMGGQRSEGQWQREGGEERDLPREAGEIRGPRRGNDLLTLTCCTLPQVYSYGPMSVERLSKDMLNSATLTDGSGLAVNASFPGGDHNGTVLPEDFCEAPSLWKRGKVYFLTTGHCCCFCFQGSGMIVYTAPQ